jgi:hypothetical protein
VVLSCMCMWLAIYRMSCHEAVLKSQSFDLNIELFKIHTIY